LTIHQLPKLLFHVTIF